MPKDVATLMQTPLDHGPNTTAGLDVPYHAAIARTNGGLSPLALGQAWADWAQHLWLSPDKLGELFQASIQQWHRFLFYCARACSDRSCPACVEPAPHDKRFAGSEWQRPPFNLLAQGFLLEEEWWRDATSGVPGASKHHADVVSFVVRQLLDIVSAWNFPLTNPVVLEQTLRQGGVTFVKGAQNFFEDWRRIATVAAETFQVGRDAAITPGKVVLAGSIVTDVGPASAACATSGLYG